MSQRISRRDALARLSTAGATALMTTRKNPAHSGPGRPSRALTVAGSPVELSVIPVNLSTLRICVQAVLENGEAGRIEDDLVLVRQDWPEPILRLRTTGETEAKSWGKNRIFISFNPLALTINDEHGQQLQILEIDTEDGSVSFDSGHGPLLGLGEGGPQFDRRGSNYPMEHGQHGPLLGDIGARVSIPFLIGTGGWAIFFHQPFGTIDLTGSEDRFIPKSADRSLPLDFFLVLHQTPAEILREYAKLTGFPHMPPIWALGYQQSHRTLDSREEVMGELKTFREKKLPCDLMIYLGTGFCPSGWNTGHGSFTFNQHVFPDPQEMIKEMHDEHFKIAVHVVIRQKDLHGSVYDTGAAALADDDAAKYWAAHLGVFRLGMDGWWPDEGDWLSPAACLVRNRMYWEGPQKDRPNLRPYALHRNGNAGMQRYGWLWSGDINSTWETLTAQVKVGINTGLSGMPFWGTDTGGFVTTPELTGELYVRWFQFSSFCPLFRSHGRTWKLRLPWGWNTGDYGPQELGGYRGKAGLPDPGELHNPEVEPICRKYLELRYRLLPYLYAAVREAHDTGLPIMRALWLHFPDDAAATGRADEYLWGRDILVAPVTEKGATSRPVYLPPGTWYDFWTESGAKGGAELARPVDLATLPLFVRAGAIIPTGPVKQYATEKVDEPATLTIYPGRDGEFKLYEDDGLTFGYEKGQSTRIRLAWDDRKRRLTINLVQGSRPIASSPRQFLVRVASTNVRHQVSFTGRPASIRL
ncbi:MAG TPA: TIM-barrel domain-containing protein [Terriglobia bacterium]|nr:TIM-barrel domain-containing protein [Terriglobia bacterium]